MAKSKRTHGENRSKWMWLVLLLSICLLVFLLNLKKEYLHTVSNGIPGTISDVDESVSDDKKDSIEDCNLQLEDARNTVYGPYTVVRVIDGDTFKVNIDGEERTVRLIGVDTPESVAKGERENDNCKEGEQVSYFIKKLAEGKDVYLEYDTQKEDKYGRLLAYVYLSNTQLQKVLLESGYARVMTVPPNVTYMERYLKIENYARNNDIGFWPTDPWT